MTMQGVSAGTIITSTGLGSNSNLSAMGSKRGRLLIRQQRIKKDNDQSNTGDLETPEASAYTEYLLPVPTAKMERHASEPSPATQLISSASTSSQNLLSVPQHSYLIKQHSHPLLPSQSQSPPTYTLQRQLSHPLQTTSTITQSTMTVQQSQQQQQQMHLIAQQKQQVHHQSAPSLITQQQVQQHQQQLSQFSSTKSESHESEMGSVVQIQGHRATQHQMSNPTVVIIPEIVSVSQGTELQQHTPQPQSQQHLQLPSIRVKSEELQRSVSSPLTSTRELSLEGARSSHCPVVRPGPALGCNFCWNTIDAHGRILRRKTKYHCPECQTNLCIVPCFQEYHERQSSENLSGNESTTTNNKASSLKHHPKAGSM